MSANLKPTLLKSHSTVVSDPMQHESCVFSISMGTRPKLQIVSIYGLLNLTRLRGMFLRNNSYLRGSELLSRPVPLTCNTQSHNDSYRCDENLAIKEPEDSEAGS
jgi:hypothetical protein